MLDGIFCRPAWADKNPGRLSLRFDLACTEVEKEGRQKLMRYTKPLIVRTEKAMAAIQQVNQHGWIGKLPGAFFDLDICSCTPSAYEADE
jgi:hypothetical protein